MRFGLVGFPQAPVQLENIRDVLVDLVSSTVAADDDVFHRSILPANYADRSLFVLDLSAAIRYNSYLLLEVELRQLGLAQLVFPGASHGRLEHIIGVVGAVEEAMRALSRQIERWNRDNKTQRLPEIEGREKFAIRLAALLHDVGHGPFSHAISVDIQKYLQGGLIAEHVKALGDVMDALYKFIDMWFSGQRVTSDLADEAALQELLRDAFILNGLRVEEGSKVGGGLLDLFVAEAILVENKFADTPGDPNKAFPAAGMQGRRYAIALGSQIVIVVGAQKAKRTKFPSKTATVSVRPISAGDVNRVEIRVLLPFGAVVPSREKSQG